MNPSIDVRTHTPAAFVVHLTVSSHKASAFPNAGMGRRYAEFLQQILKVSHFGAAVFVNPSDLNICLPHRLFRPSILCVIWVAVAFSSKQNVIRYLLTHWIS